MSAQTIFSASKKLITGVYYLAVLLGSLAIGVATFNATSNIVTGSKLLSDTEKTHSVSFEVMKFRQHDAVPPYEYAQDNKAALQVMPNKYLLHVPYQSALGYSNFFMMLFRFAATIYIIWTLKKIFDIISLKEPFVEKSAVLIRRIGWVLIIIDVVKLIYYFVFGKLANSHFENIRIELVTDFGNNIWLGFIILALSIVYKRGVEIHSENQLTI